LAVERKIQNSTLEFAAGGALRSLQWSLLSPIIAKAYATNPFYADRWRAAGVEPERIGSLDDFVARVPVVRKADFLRDQVEAPPFGRRAIHALKSGAPLRVFQTSGTSGQGQEVHLQTQQEALAVNEIYRHLYLWAGVQPGDHVFVCYPVSMLGGGQMDVGSLQAYGCTVYPVGSYDARQKLKLLDSYAPSAISGMPSYLRRLASVDGHDVAANSVRTLICSGESCGHGELSALGSRWDASVAVFYGATQLRADPLFTCECGIGSRSGDAILHNIDTHFLLEVISPETGAHVRDGEAGELVFTSLVHSDTPLLRCATGDRAIYREAGACRCGRSFSGVSLGSIERLDDMRRIKGVNVWPSAVDEVLVTVPGWRDYRVILRRDAVGADIATVKLTLEDGGTTEQAARLRSRVLEALRDRIGIGFEVDLQADAGPEDGQTKRQWIDERI
jgi:phenylacetate-CoA ligase